MRVRLDVEALQSRLNDSLTCVKQVFEHLKLDDKDVTRTLRDGSLVTVSWILAHVLSHTAIQAGQAALCISELY